MNPRIKIISSINKKILPLLMLGLMTIPIQSCSKKRVKQPTMTFPVKTARVFVKEVPNYSDTIGHVKPFITVNVRSRVEGELIDVLFKEGDEVQEGDLLFIVDPRPYQAALEKSKGELKENLANLQMALDKKNRYAPLLKEEYISQLDFDQLKTDVALYDAMIDQNKAQIKEASLNVEYAHIYAPVTGKTSLLNIQKGNLISADGTVNLVSIRQVTPIYVLFSLPEREFPKLIKSAKEKTIKIHVSSKEIAEEYIEGSLDMINNAIDPEIGSIEARGLFSNEEKILWPGEFLKVRVIYNMVPDAILIPNDGVVITTQGPIAYVVHSDQTVQLRKLELGQRQGKDIVVTKGLKKNDVIVTTGQLNLYPGAQISIVNEKEKES